MSKTFHSLVTSDASSTMQVNGDEDRDEGVSRAFSPNHNMSKSAPVPSDQNHVEVPGNEEYPAEKAVVEIAAGTRSSSSCKGGFVNGSSTSAGDELLLSKGVRIGNDRLDGKEMAKATNTNVDTTNTVKDTTVISHNNSQSPISTSSHLSSSLPSKKSSPFSSPPKHIILTGSTGSLGSYILHELLHDPSVTHITCLNRTSDAAKRQTLAHETRGLTTSFPSSRVTFLTATDLSREHLSLSPSQYNHLQQTTTHVIHNAWPVDFNKHFSTFAPQIQGVTNLLAFTRSCQAQRRVRFFFMSSVSVAGRWGAMPGALAQVPEIVLQDWRLAKMGYGQSKLVAERLVAEASEVWGLDAAVCRVAQVGGPVLNGEMGEWSRAEWVPSLVLSSKTMGVVPSTLGPMESVDWVPVDLVARICVDLLFEGQGGNEELGRGNGDNGVVKNGIDQKQDSKSKSKSKSKIQPTNKKPKHHVRVWHVVNPHTTTWSSLLPTILSHISSSTSEIKPIPFISWIEELSRRSHEAQKNGDSLADLPASKLLSFFDDLRDKAVRFPRTPSATLETKETVKYSRTMAGLQPVSKEWVELWVKQWKL